MQHVYYMCKFYTGAHFCLSLAFHFFVSTLTAGKFDCPECRFASGESYREVVEPSPTWRSCHGGYSGLPFGLDGDHAWGLCMRDVVENDGFVQDEVERFGKAFCL